MISRKKDFIEYRCPKCLTGWNSLAKGGRQNCFHCSNCDYVECLDDRDSETYRDIISDLEGDVLTLKKDLELAKLTNKVLMEVIRGNGRTTGEVANMVEEQDSEASESDVTSPEECRKEDCCGRCGNPLSGMAKSE